MIPYNPNARCSKCGGEDVSSIWMPQERCLPDCTVISRNHNMPERIERKCDRCGYTWLEEPLEVLR